MVIKSQQFKGRCVLAPAKINLDLLITGRRDDGYHLLDSIVVFTELGDELTVEKSDQLSLTISGQFANDLSNRNDNLILEAARLICKEFDIEPNLKFHLIKNLPVSSGIGGGSADAAAAIKLTIETFKLTIDQERLDSLTLSLGADIPICLRSASTHMKGIGENLNSINLHKPMNILLINPGISVSTPIIFQKYKDLYKDFDSERGHKVNYIHDRFIKKELLNSQNALESAACEVESKIKDVLAAFENLEGLWLKRMSGSGATCFGLFNNKENCIKAKNIIESQNTSWWVKVTKSI